MKYYFSFLFLWLSLSVSAQINTPTKWTYYSTKVKSNIFQVIIKVNLEPHWHIYAQKAGKGPVSTSLQFEANPLITLIDSPKEEGKLLKKFDKAFNSTLYFYDQEVSFVQLIRVRGKLKTQLNGTITYMVCDDSKCLPPTKEKFSVAIQ